MIKPRILAGIKAARELVAYPETWTQNRFAADEYGENVPLEDQAACKFCLTGAILKVNGEFDPFVLEMGRALNASGGSSLYSVTRFNDKCKDHTEFITQLDAAIAWLEREIC